jgi:hypothetical protein
MCEANGGDHAKHQRRAQRGFGLCSPQVTCPYGDRKSKSAGLKDPALHLDLQTKANADPSLAMLRSG